ncbi:branched-chain amino acid aminotransferase [Pandoraea iniqua]|uniref:aminotransferase class IV family protein n=1 Tax=Pandoraea iniqua TaxID=2508288 RepID=UPI00124054FF|nr:aminotransferase class IV family protein [Pandoraea iniqua]VVD60638.1 branched-chain amino acid aminotransferase [Pandoraea iniqua]
MAATGRQETQSTPGEVRSRAVTENASGQFVTQISRGNADERSIPEAHPATAAELTPLAFAGYAHFTAMQIRDGGVRGLDLHLARLRQASLKMFGQALPDERIKHALRAALRAGPAEMSLVATVYSPEGEFTVAGAEAVPELLVRTGPAWTGLAGGNGRTGAAESLSLATFEHERVLPELKHVGEVAKTWLLRQAAARGFDDAAFKDRAGRLSEASIWNLAFWDGESVVWPVAAMLGGTTMGILRRQLTPLGVPQREQEITVDDLPAMRGAVVMNSWTPGVAVHRIDEVSIPVDPHFVALLTQAYAREPIVMP